MDFQTLLTAIKALTPLEIWGTAFSLTGVILTARTIIWNFPVNIVACVLSFILFWQFKLYADALLQIFFLVFVLFGWWNWRRPQVETKTELPVARTPPSSLITGIIVAAICGLGWGIGLDKYTDAALPYADAQVAAFSIFGQWLVARKWIENWIVWIAVDIVASRIFWVKGLPLYSVLYGLFCVLALIGYLQWKRKLKKEHLATRKIVLIGPESTAKTTLAKQLAAHFNTTWVPEFSRHFLDVKGTIEAGDVWPILYGQAAWENAAFEEIESEKSFLFCDTDALTTQIYAAHYYAIESEQIEAFVQSRRGDFYLLCDIDLPWVADGNQRDLGHIRAEMFERFQAELIRRDWPFALVQGEADARFSAAVSALQTYFPDLSR